MTAGAFLGDRRSLARAITLVESDRQQDLEEAASLIRLANSLPPRAIRVGVTGFPGAGKSTLIEALGLMAIAGGHRVAVLAVDPSSPVSGGAILGDKTRMERLARSESAFIRPSSSRGVLGGVARQTEIAVRLCEAAGYDVVFVETVGVGQSEVSVADFTDVFLMLQLPNAGDELQAMKRGVLEKADVVVVNKMDIDVAAAQRAARQLQAGVGAAEVHVISARSETGLGELWEAVKRIAARKPRRQETGRKDPQVALARPFRILGLQQVALGAEDRSRLRHLWVDLLGLEVVGTFRSLSENVDEEICRVGPSGAEVEIDLMQPLDLQRKPTVHLPPLNHIGLWVDDLPSAVAWLTKQGVRMAPGGIRKGAAGHDVCFIHPKPGEGFPFAGEGVLIELVQAPSPLITRND